MREQHEGSALSSESATVRRRPTVTTRTVRRVAIAEASSFLILLVCMIFKYSGPRNGVPVMIMGWIHGILFLAYLAVVGSAYLSLGWSKKLTFWALVASVVPFAPYFVAHHERDQVA
jgi:integral membrane protein